MTDALEDLRLTPAGVAVNALLNERDALLIENERLRKRLQVFDARVAELEAGLHQDAWDRGYAAGQSSGYQLERAAIVAWLRQFEIRMDGHYFAHQIESGAHLAAGTGGDEP